MGVDSGHRNNTEAERDIIMMKGSRVIAPDEYSAGKESAYSLLSLPK